MGSFWGRLVGMAKSCLKKSIGREKLSFTELLTVLFEVENVLNNRLLCFVYDDDDDDDDDNDDDDDDDVSDVLRQILCCMAET